MPTGIIRRSHSVLFAEYFSRKKRAFAKSAVSAKVRKLFIKHSRHIYHHGYYTISFNIFPVLFLPQKQISSKIVIENIEIARAKPLYVGA